MRIALDATYSVSTEPSGIAVYSREILSGLARLHAEDSFLHCFRPKQYLRSQGWKATAGKRVLLSRFFPIGRADIFHALNQRLDWRPGKRTVATFHDLFVMTSEYSTPEFRTRFTEQAKRAAGNSDMIVAVSAFTARQVTELLAVEPSRIRVVPHGVHQAAPVTEAARENIILFTGALQTRKNVCRLIEAFERSHSPGWRLVLAGSTKGFGAKCILKRIEASSRRDQIEVTGYVPLERLEDLYRRAKVFAFPSLDEGFGIPVLEAMAHNLPVITSNRSALPEVAGDAAFLVDPFDVESIAAALQELTAGQELRLRLAAAGLNRVKIYSWERAVRETHAVYEQLLN